MVTRGAIKLDERHLNFRMTRQQRFLARTVAFDQEVGVSLAGFKEFRVARGSIISDGALEHVPQAVQLMAPIHRLGKQSLFGAITHPVGVQVAARFLDSYNLVDVGLSLSAKLRLRARLQEQADRLDPLVGVTVSENGTLARNVLAFGDSAEVVHVSVR